MGGAVGDEMGEVGAGGVEGVEFGGGLAGC